MSETVTLHDGRTLKVHPAWACFGPHCCIHNPSDHPLKDAAYEWFPGIGMMRRCEHGFTHPDPDDLAVKLFTHGITEGLMLIEAINSVHLVTENCDSCCQKQPLLS